MESDKNRHLNFKEIINRRIKRIIFPLLVLAIVWLPLKFYFDLNFPPIEHSVSEDILIAVNIGGWFVSAILIMYIVSLIFSYVLNRKGVKLAKFYLLLGTIIAYVVCDKILGYYTALSIPLFSVGILTSFYSSKFYKGYLFEP